jgi:transketolase
MRLRVVYVFTHDSIGLGEDGPTHQPIEHLSSLRALPFLHVWRPADSFETAVAWRSALERNDGPSILALSRQNLTQQPHPAEHDALVARGGYVVWDAPGARALLLATGSEVDLAVQAAQAMAKENLPVRVVSMPCMEVFREQPEAYREQVLPRQLRARLSIEAGAGMSWHEWVGEGGRMLSIERFGESAPIADVYRALGFTVEHITQLVRDLLAAPEG